jgi:hypothetical protein
MMSERAVERIEDIFLTVGSTPRTKPSAICCRYMIADRDLALVRVLARRFAAADPSAGETI